MKLHFEEIVELIHREMYVRNGVMLGSKAAAKAIMQAEEAAQQSAHDGEGEEIDPVTQALRNLGDAIAPPRR